MRGTGQQWSGFARWVCDETLAWRTRRGRILWAHEVHIGTMSMVPLLQSKWGQSQPRTGVVLKAPTRLRRNHRYPDPFSFGRFLSGQVDATTDGGQSWRPHTWWHLTSSTRSSQTMGLEQEDSTDRMGTVKITMEPRMQPPPTSSSESP